MIDLQKQSGLPVKVTDDFHLVFGDPLLPSKPAIRKFNDLIPVLLDKEAKATREEVYYMYRDIHLPADENNLRKNHLRYDITVIPSVMLGNEFNKTVGHYHPKNSAGVEFPELYEVLSGEGLFLIQKLDETNQNVIDFVAIRATAGQKLIYPPGYGHVIVNLGPEVLVTSNWVADNFESLYEPIRVMEGMAYFVIRDSAGYKFVPNPTYTQPPTPRQKVASDSPGFGLETAVPMYGLGVNHPENLEFLTAPEKYQKELSSLIG
jgi:glucose-6-phosphate isomerase